MSRFPAACALAAVFATTAAYADPPANLPNAELAPIATVIGETAYVLKATESGEWDVPTLSESTTVIVLGSNIARVPSAEVTLAISNGFFKVMGTVDLMVVPSLEDSDLLSRAAAKLSSDEASALIAGPFAAAEAAADMAPPEHPDAQMIFELRSSIRDVLAALNRPVRFMAADGTLFDCYGEYVAYQWGGVGLPCP